MVTEFSGPPSSGRTQLALGIAARATLQNRMRVHYVSGDGGGPWVLSNRMTKMFVDLVTPGGCSRFMTKEAKSAVFAALERVLVSSTPNAHSLLATLARSKRRRPPIVVITTAA